MFIALLAGPPLVLAVAGAIAGIASSKRSDGSRSKRMIVSAALFVLVMLVAAAFLGLWAWAVTAVTPR